MCGSSAPTPPPPQAPPAPIPKTDSKLDARAEQQRKAALGASQGYTATKLTEGSLGAATTASPVLGG